MHAKPNVWYNFFTSKVNVIRFPKSEKGFNWLVAHKSHTWNSCQIILYRKGVKVKRQGQLPGDTPPLKMKHFSNMTAEPIPVYIDL